MWVRIETFCLPKQGHSSAEYEDAYYSQQANQQDSSFFYGAVADGATESTFSGTWAQILVEAYCHDQLNKQNFVHNLVKLQQQWLSQIMTLPTLPWYAEEKLRYGAFSALLGLTLSQTSYQGRALAIGDSCLFHIRHNSLFQCFPLTQSQQFTNCPILLSSQQRRNATVTSHLHYLDFYWQPGDEFYLMTDALACWFLKTFEHQQTPWHTVRQLTQDNFQDWILQLRQRQHLLDDDVTLMRIVLNS